MTGAQEPETVSTGSRRIAEAAKTHPERSFTSLAHYIDLDWMREAYRRTRKSGAVGVDGVTAAAYEANREANLADLLERLKSGRYRAPPVRRVQIPKGDGRTRPIGIPALEDKIAQRAVAMVLEPLYEQDFRDCSYGFRPGRSPRQATESLRDTLMGIGGGWIIELDIRSFFDELDWNQLRTLLDERVRDGVLRRLIDKWLKAGVVEDGRLARPTSGTPQGGVISPLLANLYLHNVLDRWFEDEVRPRLQGIGKLFRFADDGVLVLTTERDARKVMEVLPKRFARFGLRLHPTKTRLVRFRPKAKQDRLEDEPRSFDFLGFTFYWAKSRRGNWVVKAKTAWDRFQRALDRVKDYCRRNRHRPIAEQHARLCRMLEGHYNYFGRPGNSKALRRLQFIARKIWVKWLKRRSQRGLPWERAKCLLAIFPLPEPRTAWSDTKA